MSLNCDLRTSRPTKITFVQMRDPGVLGTLIRAAQRR